MIDRCSFHHLFFDMAGNGITGKIQVPVMESTTEREEEKGMIYLHQTR